MNKNTRRHERKKFKKNKNGGEYEIEETPKGNTKANSTPMNKNTRKMNKTTRNMKKKQQ